MKILLALLLIFASISAQAEVKISQLPLGSASAVGASDSFPYVNSTGNQTQRMLLDDLANLPGMVLKYAPLASPVFTGTVSAPSLKITTGATAGYCWTATDSAGNGAWQACSGGGGGGSGTVTSVGLSLPSIFSVSGSPVTISGTLSASLVSQSANQVFASPNGSAGSPTFRALVGADLPNPSLSSKGGVQSLTCSTHQWLSQINTSGVPACTQPALSDLSGVTFSGNTTTLATTTGSLTSGNCVKIDASGNFIDAGAACGTGGGGVSTVGTYGSQTSSSDGAVISGSSIYFQPFTSANPGMVPGSGGGTSNFLRADGTWAAPAGGFSNPMTTLGDIIYENSTPAPTRLAGNTSSTKMFLSQTGTGSVSAPPVWSAISASDIPTLNQNTTGNAATATALAGTPTQCGANNWSTGVAASGNANCSQPAFSNLSGNTSVAQVHTISGSTGSPQAITAAGGITSTAAIPFQTQFVQGSGGAVTVTATSQISAGTVVGQIIYVIGTSDTNTLTLSDGSGLSLNGAITLYNHSVLALIWDGTLWNELFRRI